MRIHIVTYKRYSPKSSFDVSRSTITSARESTRVKTRVLQRALLERGVSSRSFTIQKCKSATEMNWNTSEIQFRDDRKFIGNDRSRFACSLSSLLINFNYFNARWSDSSPSWRSFADRRRVALPNYLYARDLPTTRGGGVRISNHRVTYYIKSHILIVMYLILERSFKCLGFIGF